MPRRLEFALYVASITLGLCAAAGAASCGILLGKAFYHFDGLGAGLVGGLMGSAWGVGYGLVLGLPVAAVAGFVAGRTARPVLG